MFRHKTNAIGKIVSCKWVFRHKKNAIGKIVQLKARLCARGFTQIPGIDYFDTYAPVAKLASIRILFAIAAIFDLEIQQMDVVMAFLAGYLTEEIYMEQPEGFERGDDIVCKLVKSLYGLKQAPRVWNLRVRDFLKSVGFTQTYSDPCVYINKETGIILAMWVDDFIIFGQSMDSISNLKELLQQEFEMKDLGDLKYFLGIQVNRDRSRKLIHIHQTGYTNMILDWYGMQNSKPTKIPLSVGTKLVKASISDVLTDQTEYQSIVGSQIYAMQATCPDLAHSIQQISQFSQKSTTAHITAAKQGFRYLNGTAEEGILYDGNEGLKLQAWSDANWGMEEERQSIS